MLVFANVKMAMASLRSSKMRASLTMLGIIIGVVAVVTFISFGEGLKNQVEDEIRQFGDDYLQISAGDIVTEDDQGNIESFNPASIISAQPLTEEDLEDIDTLESVSITSGVMVVGDKVSTFEKSSVGGTVIATTPEMVQIINQDLKEGSFLDDSIQNDFVVVLGNTMASDLFGSESSPLGRTVTIRGEDFTVIGVLEERDSILTGQLGTDFNNIAWISLEAGKKFNQGVVQFIQIDVKVVDIEEIDSTIEEITAVLVENRGTEDFTIFKPDDFLAFSDQILGLLTSAVVAIASISILVGGIGIMNIMFVTVSERTHEIGIRKAIGATNNQILFQFLIESIVITLLGTLVGFAISAGIVILVRTTTQFAPVITPTSLLIATVASILFGIIFGIFPAAKAARKNPIQALRHE